MEKVRGGLGYAYKMAVERMKDDKICKRRGIGEGK